MEHYVGLDVSLKQTAICIVDGTGKVQREGIVSSDPEAIAAFIKSYAPNVVRIGLETGPTATWLWTELRKLGLPVSAKASALSPADKPIPPEKALLHVGPRRAAYSALAAQA